MQSTAATHQHFVARPRSGTLVDAAIATATLGGSLALLSHGGIPGLRSTSELDLLAAALTACATLPLLAWRRAPFGVFALTAVASIAAAGLGSSPGVAVGPTAALYLLAASRDDANPWSRRATAATVAFLMAYLIGSAVAERAFPASELIHTGLLWAAAWFAGERTRLRRAHITDLEDRALHTERDAERERHLAAAEERARIARDLHDSAGHAISVIAVRAGAARLRHDEDPERSRHALQAIEQLARDTAAEIDEIIGALREDGTPRDVVEPPPGLASLDTLVERHASTGLEVTFGTVGTVRPLGGAVDRAAYRILQEALTNAARHGTGTAQIELAFGQTSLELTVANPVHETERARSRGGHGLVGMRERATLLDGSFVAERVNGTYRLHAQLPYGARRA